MFSVVATVIWKELRIVSVIIVKKRELRLWREEGKRVGGLYFIEDCEGMKIG